MFAPNRPPPSPSRDEERDTNGAPALPAAYLFLDERDSEFAHALIALLAAPEPPQRCIPDFFYL